MSPAPADPMADTERIPFCVPFRAPNELAYIEEAVAEGVRSGETRPSRLARSLLAERTGAGAVFLTTSGSAALELALLVSGIGPGDEVVVPSFTFASVANAVILRGATPVFVDVEPATLNVTAELLAPAINVRTRAVIVVHYAGVLCDMAPIVALAQTHGLVVIEDAAHAIGASREGRPAGAFGDFAAFSFHHTKNITCGEGGCLVVNDPARLEATEIAFEKGTNRRAFFRGAVDKYSWVDRGSSFIMGELNAAMLAAQLETLDEITERRLAVWNRYLDACRPLADAGLVAAPRPPQAAAHNAHLFHLLLRSPDEQSEFIAFMAERRISTPFHYVPLHSSTAGRRFGRAAGEMQTTDSVWSRLVRLPLFPTLGDRQERVIDALRQWSKLAAQHSAHGGELHMLP